MNILGIDIGYNAVKAVHEKYQTTFPSVVGTPDTARFSLNAGSDVIIEYEGTQYLVGESAIVQSRMVQRREDRHWFESTEYKILYMAALSALNLSGNVKVVTGLPVAFLADKDALQSTLTGEWLFKRNGKEYSVDAQEVKVIPQPFGTLLDLALDDDGDVVNSEIATGTIGIVDCGGKTTNLLAVSRMAEISRETASVNIGGWDVIRALREYINSQYPDRDFRDHELAEIIRLGSFNYFGKKVDVKSKIEELAAPLAQQVISQASQLWNGGASLDKIVITGGGSFLLGQYIESHFQHAETTKCPVFGNALGYHKLGVRNANKR